MFREVESLGNTYPVSVVSASGNGFKKRLLEESLREWGGSLPVSSLESKTPEVVYKFIAENVFAERENREVLIALGKSVGAAEEFLSSSGLQPGELKMFFGSDSTMYVRNNGNWIMIEKPLSMQEARRQLKIQGGNEHRDRVGSALLAIWRDESGNLGTTWSGMIDTLVPQRGKRPFDENFTAKLTKEELVYNGELISERMVLGSAGSVPTTTGLTLELIAPGEVLHEKIVNGVISKGRYHSMRLGDCPERYIDPIFGKGANLLNLFESIVLRIDGNPSADVVQAYLQVYQYVISGQNFFPHFASELLRQSEE